MSQYIAPKGLFIRAFNGLAKKDSKYHALPVVNNANDISKIKKVTYQCPLCADKAWGKPGMKIRCDSCDKRFIEQNSSKVKNKEVN